MFHLRQGLEAIIDWQLTVGDESEKFIAVSEAPL
jgi:hypothetical protein